MDPQALKDTYGKDILFWGGGVDFTADPSVWNAGRSKEQVKQRCRNLFQGRGIHL